MDKAGRILEAAEQLPTRSFGYRIAMLKHAWTRRLEAALAPTGLTHTQFVLLRALEHCMADQPSQTKLADLLGIDRMTASKVLRTLERKGLLTRAPHPDDPRANHVAMTETGLVVVRQATALALTEQERFFGRLGAERKAAFSQMLDDLLDQPGCRARAAAEDA